MIPTVTECRTVASAALATSGGSVVHRPQAGMFLIDFFGYFLPATLAADVDTTGFSFTLVFFVCHTIYSFRLLNRSGDNRYGCQF